MQGALRYYPRIVVRDVVVTRVWVAVGIRVRVGISVAVEIY